MNSFDTGPFGNMNLSERKSYRTVSDFTYCVTSANGHQVFVKSHAPCEHFGYGDVLSEFDSYKVLRGYLKMPHARVIFPNTQPLLVIKEVAGESVHDLLKIGNPTLAIQTVDKFFQDTSRMWGITEIDMNRSDLAYDPFANSIKMLDRIRATIRDDINATINTSANLSLESTFQSVYRDLEDGESKMVLGHGDENLMNLFAGKNGYVILDPRVAGYYSPSCTLNMSLVHPLLFIFDYENLLPVESQTVTYNAWADYIQCKLAWFDELYPDNKLRALMFVNLARTTVGGVNPKNLPKTYKNRLAHLSLALSIYNNESLTC